jgi:hypothetical protein
MSKLHLATALCLFCFASPMLAANAESTPQKVDSTTTVIQQSKSDQTTDNQSDPKPIAKPGTASTSGLRSRGNMGVRLTSFAAGSTLGLPVATVRLFIGNDKEQAKSMPFIGESTHKGFIWMSRVVVIVPAVFVAFISAPGYSVVNSWKVSSDKPFSKECFGLGQWDPSICPY